MIVGALLVGVAYADEAAPDPAKGPAFVSVERLDALSRVGLDYTYVDRVHAKPINRLELHAHFVEPRSRAGGYVQMPYTVQRYDDVDRTRTYGVFGHGELGGLWVPRLPSRYVALVVHAGVALPVDDDRTSPGDVSDAATRGALVRPHEIHTTFAGALAVRTGASALVRYASMYSRIDLGYDESFASDTYPLDTGSVIVNAAIGLTSRMGLSFAVELSTISRISDAPYEIFRSESYDDTNTLLAVALSLRYQRGRFQVYAAREIPLRPPQRHYVRSGLTLGVEVAL
jgi:hypothetical protein